MRVKCTKCQQFVPINEEVYQYCVGCGADLCKDGPFPNMPKQIALSKEAKRKLAAAGGREFLIYIIGAALVLPLLLHATGYPLQGWKLWAWETVCVAVWAVSDWRSDERVIKQYSNVFRNDHWEP